MQNEKIEKIAQERIDQVRNKVEIMSEFARSNKLAMGAHIFIAALISLTYLIEVFKGSRSIGYVAFVIVLGLASPIAEIINSRFSAFNTALCSYHCIQQK